MKNLILLSLCLTALVPYKSFAQTSDTETAALAAGAAGTASYLALRSKNIYGTGTPLKLSQEDISDLSKKIGTGDNDVVIKAKSSDQKIKLTATKPTPAAAESLLKRAQAGEWDHIRSINVKNNKITWSRFKDSMKHASLFKLATVAGFAVASGNLIKELVSSSDSNAGEDDSSRGFIEEPSAGGFSAETIEIGAEKVYGPMKNPAGKAQ